MNEWPQGSIADFVWETWKLENYLIPLHKKIEFTLFFFIYCRAIVRFMLKTCMKTYTKKILARRVLARLLPNGRERHLRFAYGRPNLQTRSLNGRPKLMILRPTSGESRIKFPCSFYTIETKT